MKYRDQKTIIYILVLIVVVMGILFGTLYDLEIAETLSFSQDNLGNYVAKNNVFFSIIITLSYWCVPIIGAFCAVVLARIILLGRSENIKNGKKDNSIIFTILLFLVSLVFITYSSVATISSFSDKMYFWHYFISILMSIVVAGLLTYIVFATPVVKFKSIAYGTITTLITIVAIYFVCGVFMLIFGRMSPANLAAMGDVETNYKAWYQLSPSIKNRAFPSIHIALSTFLFSLPVFFSDYKVNSKKYFITNISVLAWIILLGFALLLTGTNYLSDISLGFALGFVANEFNKRFYLKLSESKNQL